MTYRFSMPAILAVLAVAAWPASAQGIGPDFAMLDRDGDGSVTLEELQSLSAARFTAADTNDDGALSAAEMAAAAAARAQDRASRLIARFDTNADGVLQMAEMPDRGQDRAERIFERVDTDADGLMSEAEFEAARDMWRARADARRD